MRYDDNGPELDTFTYYSRNSYSPVWLAAVTLFPMSWDSPVWASPCLKWRSSLETWRKILEIFFNFQFLFFRWIPSKNVLVFFQSDCRCEGRDLTEDNLDLTSPNPHIFHGKLLGWSPKLNPNTLLINKCLFISFKTVFGVKNELLENPY